MVLSPNPSIVLYFFVLYSAALETVMLEANAAVDEITFSLQGWVWTALAVSVLNAR